MHSDATPILIGLDALRAYGIFLDYYNGTVYSHTLERYIESMILPSGHLAMKLFDSYAVPDSGNKERDAVE